MAAIAPHTVLPNRVAVRLADDDDARARVAFDAERAAVLDDVSRDPVLGLLRQRRRELDVRGRAHRNADALHVVDVAVGDRDAVRTVPERDAGAVADALAAVHLGLEDPCALRFVPDDHAGAVRAVREEPAHEAAANRHVARPHTDADVDVLEHASLDHFAVDDGVIADVLDDVRLRCAAHSRPML